MVKELHFARGALGFRGTQFEYHWDDRWGFMVSTLHITRKGM